MEKLLFQKIADPAQPVIFYELTPPAHDSNEKCINAYATCAIEMFESLEFKIDAINIPEIHDETRPKLLGRSEPFEPKMNIGRFAELLRDVSHDHLEIILNHGAVHESWEDQKIWLKNTIENHKIKLLILVGGESSQIQYPGPSVIEMSQYIHAHYHTEVCCGGITIQNRRSADIAKDEPSRLLNKIQNGLQFFTTQIIYESQSVIKLLKDYHEQCQEQGIQPKRIFLSFAPISTQKNLKFLRWLGVTIPVAIEEVLLESDIGVGWRSVKIAVSLLKDILTFMKDEQIQVPIGLNIEHISRSNFELTKELMTQLGRVYLSFYQV